MDIVIVGSAGSLPIPRFGCSCGTCERFENSKKHLTGSSLLVKSRGGNVLVDTPFGLSNALRSINVKTISTVLYTHWHPDHVEGFRFFEDAVSSYEQPKPPIRVVAPSSVIRDITHHFPTFSYIDQKKWVQIEHCAENEPFSISDDFHVIPIKIDTLEAHVFAYLFEERGKRILYAPCDARSRKNAWDELGSVDVLFLESPFPITAALRKKLPKRHIWQQHLSVEEAKEIVEALKPKRIVFTHIDGARHLSEDMLDKRCLKTFDNAVFAFDGMKLRI